MKFWTKITLALVPALFLIGCGTSGEVKEGSTGAAAGATTSGSSATTSGVETGGAGTATGEGMEQGKAFQGNPLDDPNSLLAKRVIYFDFDKSAIKDEFRDIIAAHAKYLADNPNATVTVEGHTDERGTREYNLALGERRAAAVKQMLILQGAAASQINTISYGEERPAALGHDEQAWALNRRAELVYKRE
jgi:peptidoglycan-associated lipoprotein